MRLKHIKDAETLIYESKYVIKEPFKNKDNWNNEFDNEFPIEVEVGMGKGNFLISKALDNPNINYIGIEKYASVILSATKRLDELGLQNVRIICIDANKIDEIFGKEIIKLYLNFSDPWPKKRHEKRRLTSNCFLEKYELIFNGKTDIEMKTDNDDLFEYSIEQFKNNGYDIVELNYNVIAKYQTEYERKFILTGKNINYCKVIK